MIAKRPSPSKTAKPRRLTKIPQSPAHGEAAKHSKNGIEKDLESRDRITTLQASIRHLGKVIEHQKVVISSLNESRGYFLALFENSPAACIVHDKSGFIQQINPAGAALLGLKYSTRFQASLPQFFSERDMGLWLTHMRRATARKETVSRVTLKPREGRSRQFQLMTRAWPAVFPNKASRFITITSDVSRYDARQWVNYERLIDLIEGIVWEADVRTLKFIYVSRYVERLLGYRTSDWISPGFWQNRIYTRDRERVLNELHRAIDKRTELRLDYRVVAADGRLVWLHDSIRVIERSGLSFLLGVAIDVTEQRNAEQQMRRAHANLEEKVGQRTEELQKTVLELEAFSYSLSHDMRAPIRAMRGYAELVQHMAGDKLGHVAPEYLRRIMGSAERLDLLVQDVLQFNRVSRAPVEMKPVSLDPLINNILHDYPALAPAKAQIVIQQPLLPIRGHEAFVGQALLNLLSNAVKFVPKDRMPKVRLWTEEAERHLKPNANKLSDAGKWVRIWVEDNGLGISPQDQKRIFKMFERVHSAQEFEGTGIGLTIVQKAVERMGGQVGVESAPGHGSKFWIELPPA